MSPSMLLHICTKSGRENTFLPIVFPNLCILRCVALALYHTNFKLATESYFANKKVCPDKEHTEKVNSPRKLQHQRSFHTGMSKKENTFC